MKKIKIKNKSTVVSYLIKKRIGVLSMNIKNLIQGIITQNELLNYLNATIVYETLPKGVNGFVFYYDGIYFIILDNSMGLYKRQKTLLHELAHIELNQLCQSNKELFAFYIEEYEDAADKYIYKIKEKLSSI